MRTERRFRFGRIALVAATLLPVAIGGSAVATSEPAAAASPVPVRGRVCLADTSPVALDGMFEREPGGVVGADYQRAHELPDGRVLWTFQDGAIRGDDGKVRIVHNIAVVQDDACFDVLYRGTRSAPRPFLFDGITIPYERWYWPLDGELGTDGMLYVFAAEMTEHGPDYLSEVRPTTTKVALIDPTTLAVVDERPAPDDSARLHGWSITSDHDWTYLYAHCYRQFGYERYLGVPAFDASCSTRITVARVPRGRFDVPLAYWDGARWQADPARSAPVVPTAGRRINADQIIWTGARFLSVNKEGDWWGTTVYLSSATSATGPFEVYATIPLPTICADCNTFFANWIPRSATEIPALTRAISWSNNRWDGEPSPAYRPRYRGVAELPYLPASGTTRVDVPGGRGRSAVLVNLAAVRTADHGYLTAFPCDRPAPVASNVNHLAGEVVAGTALVRPDADGHVCVRTRAEGDLVVDLAGGFESTSGLEAIDAPARVLDTRTGLGGPAGLVPAGGSVRVQDPEWVGAAAVGINVTATGTRNPGYVTAHPCDRPPPLASHVNSRPGRAVANLVLVRPDPEGAVCVFTSAPTHLVVDHAAVFVRPGAGTDTFGPVDTPERVVDTRDGTGAPARRVAAGGILVVDLPAVVGQAGVALNVTVVDPLAAGYVTAFPCDEPVPTASNVNHRAGGVVANLVVARADDAGRVCLFASAATHLVVDHAGTFGAGGGFVPEPATLRLVDSRIGLGTAG